MKLIKKWWKSKTEYEKGTTTGITSIITILFIISWITSPFTPSQLLISLLLIILIDMIIQQYKNIKYENKHSQGWVKVNKLNNKKIRKLQQEEE